jgi:transposase InsO family protein
MDFLELESVTGSDGKDYDYILVIVCRLSGYLTALPCRKSGLTAQHVAQLFLERCVCFMGLPNEIVSDQDHLISSRFFTTLCSLVGVEQHFSIIYRPKGNGRAEAAVKAIVNMLRLALADCRTTWLQALPWAVFQANNLPGIILPFSPHRIVFGRDPPAIGDIPSSQPSRVSVSCETWFAEINSFRQQVQQKLTLQHEKVRQRFLKEFKAFSYEPGDKVWIRNSKNRTGSNKLDPLWTGPCEILDRVGSTGRYKVVLPSGVEDVHMDDFKPYLSPPDGKAIPCLYFKPRSKLPETDDFVVHKILDHKVEKGVHFWKVRWKGYGAEEDTWEPASSFVGYVQQDWKLWNKAHNVQVPLQAL